MMTNKPTTEALAAAFDSVKNDKYDENKKALTQHIHEITNKNSKVVSNFIEGLLVNVIRRNDGELSNEALSTILCSLFEAALLMGWLMHDEHPTTGKTTGETDEAE